MPLNAFLFAGDAQLEAALVDDRAHILEGAQGEHVAKIQAALMALDKATISPLELQAQAYGPSTSRAVQAYKSKRRIINFSYQNSADAIVGKMTMRKLDDELLVLQQSSENLGEGSQCLIEDQSASVIAERRLALFRAARQNGSGVA